MKSVCPIALAALLCGLVTPVTFAQQTAGASQAKPDPQKPAEQKPSEQKPAEQKPEEKPAAPAMPPGGMM